MSKELEENTETKPASITIKFSSPDEDGNVSTDVTADAMSIQHFQHLIALSKWYIENEFPQEEQDKAAKRSDGTVEEK